MPRCSDKSTKTTIRKLPLASSTDSEPRQERLPEITINPACDDMIRIPLLIRHQLHKAPGNLGKGGA